MQREPHPDPAAAEPSAGRPQTDGDPSRSSTRKFLLSGTAEGPKAAEPAPRATETILLVEDERAVRALVLRGLLRHGYAVLEASNGREALAVFARHRGPIHLLLTDVVMPEMGGRELAERLITAAPDLRVLFVSGYMEDEAFREGVFENRIHFLPKPLSPGTLARKVREVLDAPPPAP
jgi:CheY-like chemotaxis protein